MKIKIKKKHKNLCSFELYWTLNVIYTITGCFSVSAFASLVGISIGITSSAIGVKMCPIIAGIKKYKLINKEKGRNIMK